MIFSKIFRKFNLSVFQFEIPRVLPGFVKLVSKYDYLNTCFFRARILILDARGVQEQGADIKIIVHV